MFDKVLVANRGEIAIRIIKTLKKMNIKSVAVYSEADSNALHVQVADEACCIGSSPATESYLSIKNVIAAIKKSGAQAVHPGYGFLSENNKFAAKLEKENVILIGPNKTSIKKMGDKIEAKKIAISAGVNTVPGYVGIIENVEKAISITEKIGFPIIVKAASGGGGRGMRVVETQEDMIDAFESAKIESLNSFKDSRVFIEKLIINKPRHIEIQILADHYGNIVCLGERECSIQRLHQKVIEEAPSSFIDNATRKKMYQQAKALAKKVSYYSAGTAEFLIDENKNFYFLEMNTRIQVEHPVTELVTGVDIVEEMIKIAAGKKLSIKQEDIDIKKKWAIECRICAENPKRGFLPSSGIITHYQEPKKSEFIRIDSGINEGCEVSMYYDTMIAKLCSVSSDRKKAINLMKEALSSFVISGISHNIGFLEALISHKKFIKGDINTNFIDEEYPKGFAGAKLTSEITKIFVAVGTYIFITENKRMFSISKQLNKELHKIGNKWIVNIDGYAYPVGIRSIPDGYDISQSNNKISIKSDWSVGNNLFSCNVNGKNINVKVEHQRTQYIFKYAGVSAKVYVRSPRIYELENIMLYTKLLTDNKSKETRASLSGEVTSIKCKVSQIVNKGDNLITLMAMKMENSIKAHMDGKIKKVNVKNGDFVNVDDVLIEYE